jgi:glycine cleavage system H lipoate-binding protein
MPLDGEVLEVNPRSTTALSWSTKDPLGEGWFFR